MSAKADLQEYLELYKSVVERKELPAEEWAPTLIPLLNDRFRRTAVKLPPEVKGQYNTLKVALLERDDYQTKNLVATYWTLTKDRGVSALEFAQHILRLLSRFMEGEDRAACMNSMAKERFIHELPKEGRAFIRQRKPKSLLEATILAEEFFHMLEDSYTTWSSSAHGGHSGHNSYRKDRYPYSKGRRSGSPRYQRRDSPPRSKDRKTATKAPKQEAKGTQAEQREKKAHNQQRPKKDPRSGKCFACGEAGHKQTNCPSRVNRVEAQVKCQLCDGNSHGAKDCPSKVNRVSTALGTPQPSNHLRTGVANGTAVQDILLDSGADVSTVAEEILNRDYKKCGSIGLKPLASQRIQCPATMVPIKIGNHSFTVKAAVMPKKNLGLHLLLGRNIPGINIEDLIAETRAPLEVGTQSTTQPAVTPKDEAQQTPAQTLDSDSVEAPVGTPTPPEVAEPQEVGEEKDEDQGPLHLVNVVTRERTRNSSSWTSRLTRRLAITSPPGKTSH